MSYRHTNRRTIVQAVCVCQIDSSRLHCCTCPQHTGSCEFREFEDFLSLSSKKSFSHGFFVGLVFSGFGFQRHQQGSGEDGAMK
jgi:hypothetical protein